MFRYAKCYWFQLCTIFFYTFHSIYTLPSTRAVRTMEDNHPVGSVATMYIVTNNTCMKNLFVSENVSALIFIIACISRYIFSSVYSSTYENMLIRESSLNFGIINFLCALKLFSTCSSLQTCTCTHASPFTCQ